MTKNIENDVKKIVSEEFNISLENVNLETSPRNVDLWDSLGQLNLVSQLEQYFSIVFEFEELFKIVSVRTIISVINEKLNAK